MTNAGQNLSGAKQFFFTLPGNVLACFKGWMLLWHVVAIVLTFILVRSGFDWWYFRVADKPLVRAWMFPAAGIGFIVPIYLPLALVAAGYVVKSTRCMMAGCAVAQAEVIGLIISSTYKAFTGRVHPLHNGTEDITHVFRFGFLRGGVFWGWPSSHTTIAFAMAFTVWNLFPKQRWLGAVAIAYAGYIGVGVSTTIHWFSDFVAGAIIGAVVGTVVGRSFACGRTGVVPVPN